MTGVAGLLEEICSLLDRLGVPYMIAGSVASSFHGEPRTTRDLDVVIEVDADGVTRLVQSLDEERFYVSGTEAEEAVRGSGQFNVIDMQSGYKADLIVRKRRPFCEAEFSRRAKVPLLGITVWVASAEDTVLTKLECSMKGGSDRQVRDAAGIVAAQGPLLDLGYLRRWALELGVADALEELLGSAGPVGGGPAT